MEEENKNEVVQQEAPAAGQAEPQKRKNVFSYPNYTLTFFGALVSNLGGLLYSFAVSFYVLRLTDNNAFIQGLYLAVGGTVYVLVTLFGGVISDRFHKGKIMYICDYLRGGIIIAFTLILMFLCPTNVSKVIVLFVIDVLGNIIGAIFSPASASLLPQIIPEESLQQGQSYYSVMSSSISILGVVLAGILYSTLPINVLFFIVGGCYILSAISEMFIRYNHQKSEEKLTIKVVFSDIGTGFKYLFNLKPIFYLMIVILFVNFFFSPVTSNFLPYFVATDIASSEYLFKNFMEPEMWNSLISVAFAVGMIIMSLIMSARQAKPSIVKGLRLSFVLVCACLIGLAASYFIYNEGIMEINPMIIIFVVGAFGIGLILPSINIPTTTKMMTVVDKGMLGKVFAVIDIGSQGLIPLSSFLAGIAIETLGPSWLLVISASGLAILAVILFINRQIAKL